MRFNGEWLVCSDGDKRPVIRAEILLGDSIWREFELLVDTGADRTVLSADVFLGGNQPLWSAQGQIGGVGGVVDTYLLRTQIRIRRDDGVHVAFHGEYAALANADVLDMSVLGRDILNSFAVIIDRPANTVVVLGGNHRYSIESNA